MSCKYCKPLESTGETEPLVEFGDHYKCRIVGNKLKLEVFGSSVAKVMDFCPNCGEELKPFGSLLFGRYGGKK